MSGDLDQYLGAARVVRVGPRTLTVALEEGETARGTVVQATPALAFPYACVVGDQLLVIGDARAFYVIGVLQGRGQASVPGGRSVSVTAEGGALELLGDRGVRLTGRSIRIEAEGFRQLAVRLVQTLGERITSIRGRSRIEAGQLDELSQGRFTVSTNRADVRTLDGARITSPAVRVG